MKILIFVFITNTFLLSCRGSFCYCHKKTYLNGTLINDERLTEDPPNQSIKCSNYNDTLTYTNSQGTITEIYTCEYN